MEIAFPRPIRQFTAFAVVTDVLAVATPAAEDAVDGNWCFGVKRLEIFDSEILTPGGNKLQGHYGRHDFNYTVPAGEPGARATVDMELLGDDDLRLRPTERTPDPAKPGAQMWKHCAPPVS